MSPKPEMTVREHAESILRTNDELLKRAEQTYVSAFSPLSPVEIHVATYMYLMGILTNPQSIEEADAVYEAFKIRLGYTDDEIATDIIGG